MTQVLPTGFGRREREREEKREEEEEARERVYLLSRFFGDPSVESRRDKRQSWSPLQELRVSTGIVEFQQLREVGVFSYLVYSLANNHFNG